MVLDFIKKSGPNSLDHFFEGSKKALIGVEGVQIGAKFITESEGDDLIVMLNGPMGRYFVKEFLETYKPLFKSPHFIHSLQRAKTDFDYLLNLRKQYDIYDL